MPPPALSLQQLRYLVAVQEASSLSSAAKSLGVKLPSLSVALSRIEEAVGVELTAGSPRPRLTSAGQVLADCARNVLRDVDQAIVTARNTPNANAASTPLNAETAFPPPLNVAPLVNTGSSQLGSPTKSAQSRTTVEAVPLEAASLYSLAQRPTGRTARRTWVGQCLADFQLDYARRLHRFPPISEVASGFRMRTEGNRPAELNNLIEKQLTLRWVAEDGFPSRMNADHLCAIPVFVDRFDYVAFRKGQTILRGSSVELANLQYRTLRLLPGGARRADLDKRLANISTPLSLLEDANWPTILLGEDHGVLLPSCWVPHVPADFEVVPIRDLEFVATLFLVHRPLSDETALPKLRSFADAIRQELTLSAERATR